MEKLRNDERFTLTPLDNGTWKACDHLAHIIVTFREHRFEETRKVTHDGKLDDATAAREYAEGLRDLTYWLLHNHYDVLRPLLTDRRAALGRRIQELRTARGWTQTELAMRAGLTVCNVTRIELGKYSTGVDVVNRLADALGVTLDLR